MSNIEDIWRKRNLLNFTRIFTYPPHSTQLSLPPEFRVNSISENTIPLSLLRHR
jgi:hypothetical protein